MNLHADTVSVSSNVPSADTASVVLEVQGLTKRYPVRRSWAQMLRRPRHGAEVMAVDDVSFDVKKGEFFGLLGPNGAGKTTLFKVLSTLIDPDAGTARVAGHDLLEKPELVRALVSPVIADERSLNWRLSATENLRFYAALYGLGAGERDERVIQLLEVVGLEEAGYKIVGAFSSGMKQRLLLARALLGRPTVLLLDEPTRSLDPVAARRFRAFLKDEIAGRQGCSVLLATHNSEEALKLSDRIGVLDKGRMIAVGRPEELNQQAAGYRYRLWTWTPEHPAFRETGLSKSISNVFLKFESNGMSVVELDLANDEERPAEVLAMLIQAGVRISRFERVQLPLAELIEHLVRAGGNHDGS